MVTLIILLFFILPTLNAPTWCFVLAWISFGIRIFDIVVSSAIESYKKIKKQKEEFLF